MTPDPPVADRAAERPGARGLLWVVARREMAVKLRDRAFIVSGVVMLVLIGAALVVPALLAGGPDRVAVLDAPTAAVVEATGAEAVTTSSGTGIPVLLPVCAMVVSNRMAAVSRDDGPRD